MIIFPAIDLLGGNCVRLVRGEYGSASRVAEDALETAKGFKALGAEYIHMVDLDGARDGRASFKNRQTAFAVARETGLPVELGGGVRTEEDIAELAEHSANTVPVMMPYIDAFFMPRAMGDRPDVVPEGAVNFAFLGQFAETARDTIFTTEYSMRTGMEAVYTLLNIDRGVPEVWGSTYDVRALIDATVKLRDGKKITDMDLPLIPRLALKEALKKIEGTDLEKFLKEYNAI